MEKLLAKASADHQAGRLGPAETGYRRVLEADPARPEALHGLGLIALQMNNLGAALGLLERAAAL
ncbi:MAG: hypothetical protein QGF09_15500, partial [Rhodospirillales bacterium]|nr:hypothetical protein [Rhodospirillales bacterium]